MKKKIKVIVELEIDAVDGLNVVGNTIEEVVECILDNGFSYEDEFSKEKNSDMCKIIKIKSDEIDVIWFYESGDAYVNGVSYKDCAEYQKSFE